MNRGWPGVAVVLWLVPWLAACGGGGGRTAAVTDDGAALSLEPQAEPLDADQQTHLPLRTQWAVNPTEREALASLGLAAYVDRILDPPQEPDVEAQAARHIVYPLNPSGQDLALWWVTLMTKTRRSVDAAGRGGLPLRVPRTARRPLRGRPGAGVRRGLRAHAAGTLLVGTGHRHETRRLGAGSLSTSN